MPPKTRRRRPDATANAGFASQLRDIISGRRLSAYWVAQTAGVAPSVVSRFLSRERGLTLATFDLIAGALGLKLVESGRGRGRPSPAARSPREPVDVAGVEGPAGVPSGIVGTDLPERPPAVPVPDQVDDPIVP
jgi:hypothetical protein